MRCPDVPMPKQVAELRQDARGYPVPFFLDNGAVTDFRAMNGPNVYRAIEERLCAICGQPLAYWIVFMGGPKSCENRVFTDPPFHPVCADYAAAVCPFIVHEGWSREHLKEKLPELKTRDPAGTFDRYRMQRYLTRGFVIFRTTGGGLLFRADAPKSIERARAA